jgi:valyl-tRNA synthetase
MAEKIEKATRKEFPNGIPAFGADALRFTFASLATHGRDIKFDLHRAEGYKNFCNKLWNAARFALMNCESFTVGASLRPPRMAGVANAQEHAFDLATNVNGDAGVASKLAPTPPQPRTDAERWILARLARTSAEVQAQFAAYRFDLVSQALYEFAWNEFCDWFLELVKPALAGDDQADADSTRHTLLFVLEQLLRLLHPLIPFVSEEIWQSVAPKLGLSGSISQQAYPEPMQFAGGFAAAEADIEWLKAAVSALRSIRSSLGISPAKHIQLLFRGNDADTARVAKFSTQLSFLLKLENIEALAGEPPAAAPAVVGDLQLFVPLAGLVDLDAERARLDKEIAKVAAEREKSEAKLAKFGSNVPPAVVEQERTRLTDWNRQFAALSEQRQRL